MSDDWRRVNALFHEALERPSDERERFVAEQAGGDEALRREVLSLVDAHGRAGSFLESPIVPHDPHVLASGATVGAYRVDREIGRGGMGIVYLAEDTRLGRLVALKMLPAAFARDSRRRERLRLEARAAARLSHPGIATVFALEEIDGDLFLVSEYVQGRTARGELDAGQVPVDRVIEIAVKVARALAAAHAQGIVHRDLKPENVISGDQGVVKVLDFGVARSLPAPGETDDRLTEPGMVVGTQAYMSPEQLEGAAVDSRSDVFSFGILLYELATGVHPFEGSSSASTIARILTLEPVPPRELRRHLPPDLDRIVSKCLEKRPEARYQSTADLVVDLERLGRVDRPSAGQVSVSARRSPGEAMAAPQARWWRVHQLVITGLYAAMTPVAWLAADLGSGTWPRALFFASVGVAALNGTLRVHLLFTERHNRPAFRGELRRSTPWLRVSDIGFGLILLTLSAPLARGLAPLAIVLAAVGAAAIIVSLAVEPATRDAAFPKRLSGVRPGRPQRRNPD